jgi:alpha-glucoside transport system permease protein
VKTGRRRRRVPVANLARRALVHVVLVGVCAAWLIPVAGLLVSSVRPARDVAASGWWTVVTQRNVTLENYAAVVETANFGFSFLNSVAVAVPGTVIPLLIAAPAAHALAWMQVPGRRLILGLVVALLIVPLQSTLIPVLRLLTAIGLTGTLPAVWLAHTAYALPLGIYLLHSFISALPRELLECAALDGASPPVVFSRVVLPLAAPALASLAIFQFLWVWNDLLVALIYLGGSPAVAPMTVTISNLVNSLGGGWHLLTAAAFISMIVPLVVFLGFQRSFVRGFLTGGLKG